jgi:hypothetical protein
MQTCGREWCACMGGGGLETTKPRCRELSGLVVWLSRTWSGLSTEVLT